MLGLPTEVDLELPLQVIQCCEILDGKAVGGDHDPHVLNP
jgi:hypothetical protein